MLHSYSTKMKMIEETKLKKTEDIYRTAKRDQSNADLKPKEKPFLQKIKENEELQLSWADMIDEFESNGVTIDHGIDTKVIVSGPQM